MPLAKYVKILYLLVLSIIKKKENLFINIKYLVCTFVYIFMYFMWDTEVLKS